VSSWRLEERYVGLNSGHRPCSLRGFLKAPIHPPLVICSVLDPIFPNYLMPRPKPANESSPSRNPSNRAAKLPFAIALSSSCLRWLLPPASPPPPPYPGFAVILTVTLCHLHGPSDILHQLGLAVPHRLAARPTTVTTATCRGPRPSLYTCYLTR